MLLHSLRHIARLALPCILASMSFFVRSSAAQRASSAMPSADPGSCIEGATVAAPARLDARHQLYVEQQTVTANRHGRVLVAGTPVFHWAKTATGHDLASKDSLIGMTIDPPSRVTALASPMPGKTLDAFRSVPMSDGWWLVTFAEVMSGPAQVQPKVVAMWAGETDGTTWRGLERLPDATDSLSVRSFSDLVFRDGRAVLATRAHRGFERYLVLYTRRAGQWHLTTQHFRAVGYPTLALTASHDVLALVTTDSTEQRDHNSLFVYTKQSDDSVFVNPTRVVRGLGQPTHGPVMRNHGHDVQLTWRVRSESTDPETAWFTRLNSRAEVVAPIRKLASGTQHLTAATSSGRDAWVVAGRTQSQLLNTLQVLESDGSDRVVTSRVESTEYLGPLGMTLAHGYLIVVASKPSNRSTDPPVVSVIHAFPWRCR